MRVISSSADQVEVHADENFPGAVYRCGAYVQR